MFAALKTAMVAVTMHTAQISVPHPSMPKSRPQVPDVIYDAAQEHGKEIIEIAADKAITAIVPGGAETVIASEVVKKIIENSSLIFQMQGGWHDWLNNKYDENKEKAKQAAEAKVKEEAKRKAKEEAMKKVNEKYTPEQIATMNDMMNVPQVKDQVDDMLEVAGYNADDMQGLLDEILNNNSNNQDSADFYIDYN